LGEPRYTFFLISPANLGGERGKLIFKPTATFQLAEQLRSSEGAPLGSVFSFISGLYFRGKMTYAEAFGRAPEGLSGGLVISPAEGLRFLYEPVDTRRLRAWAEVSIDESNPSFTRPLIEHASALLRTFGADARYVLLGSVATDKYVKPLGEVFGERLLFPPEFLGRGDMSRGALLLRAARAGVELPYAPVATSERHGPRAAKLARRPAIERPRRRAPRNGDASDAPRRPGELVILIGLPGAGKSTFARQRFATSHVSISLDDLRRSRQPLRRQNELLREALRAGSPVVVDNTNVGVKERAELIATARAHGARVKVYLFTATSRECIARNLRREGVARVPNVAILAAARRLVRPAFDEGFDELYLVETRPDHSFEVTPDDGRA
jgi:predicted kinase